MRTIIPTLATAALLALGLPTGTAFAQHDHAQHGDDESAAGHSHAQAELHGGSVTMTPDHHFEVVFAAAEMRVYAYDGKQVPIQSLKDVAVSGTLHAKEGDPIGVEFEYVAPDEEAGRSQGYFVAAYDFSEVEDGTLKAMIEVAGLSKEPVKFRTAVSVGELATYACPMHDAVVGEDPVACSKCGMALTRVPGHEDESEDDHDHGGHH